MNNIKILNNIKQNSENSYLLMFGSMLGIKMAGFYDGQMVFKLVFVLYVLLFIAKMALTKYTVKEYVFSALLILLSGLVYLRTGEKGLFLCFSMMLGIKAVSVKKVMSCGAIISGIIVSFKIFASAFGFIPEKYYSTYRSGVGEQIRHSLGYVHPNTLHISFFVLMILVVYVATKYKYHVVLISAVFLALNLYIYQYSGSRTGFLCGLIYLILNIWNYYRKKISLIEKILYFLTYPMTCIVTIVLPLLLKGRAFSLLDDYVFNLRYTMAKYYVEHNGISLFGIRLNNPDNLPYSIDMAGMYLFLQLGIVAFVVISVLSIWYIKMAIKLDMKAELSAYIAICLAGLWEPFLYNTSYKNIAFVFIGAVIFGFQSEKENDSLKNTTDSTKALCIRLLGGILFSAIAVALFLMLTDPYTVMYADVEAPRIDQTNVQEPIYLTSEEENTIIENGGIVMRYGSSDAPVYEYSIDTAANEYDLKVMSIFIFAFLTFILIEYACFYIIKKEALQWKR